MTGILHKAAALGLFAGLQLLSCPVTAQESQLSDDLIRSDIPIYGSKYEDKWPQGFNDPGTGDFGCTSRVDFGDWLYKPSEVEDASVWYRFSNYGVFHCWANAGTADEQRHLSIAASRPAFFVRLGTMRYQERTLELWTLQIGAHPGSDYLLLSRAAGDGVITTFTVLQRRCRPAAVRKGPRLDILRTDYCAVQDAAELKRMALAAVRLAPLGTLERVSDADDADAAEKQ